MSDRKETIEKELFELINEDIEDALMFITGCFVGLMTGYLKSRGHEHDCDIRINGGENCDITIHKPKDSTCES